MRLHIFNPLQRRHALRSLNWDKLKYKFFKAIFLWELTILREGNFLKLAHKKSINKKNLMTNNDKIIFKKLIPRLPIVPSNFPMLLYIFYAVCYNRQKGKEMKVDIVRRKLNVLMCELHDQKPRWILRRRKTQGGVGRIQPYFEMNRKGFSFLGQLFMCVVAAAVAIVYRF